MSLSEIREANTEAQRPSQRGRWAFGKVNRDTRKTRGAEGGPGGNCRSNPPRGSGVALAGSFCPWFPLLKNRGAGRLRGGG